MSVNDIIARFLEEQVAPRLADSDRRLRFHALIAANQLREEERLGPNRARLDAQELAVLSEFLESPAEDVDEARSQLATRLRSGALDPELPNLARRLRTVLDTRLAVQKPGFNRQSDIDGARSRLPGTPRP